MRGMAHAATYYPVTQSVDDHNQPVLTRGTGIPVMCRFYQARDSPYGSPAIARTNLKVMLEATVPVALGGVLVSVVPGYSGTYQIESITPYYGRVSLHHYTCDIILVEPTPDVVVENDHSAVLGYFVLGEAVLGES